MPISILNAYWLAITQIEAEQTLLGIQVSSFPEYKKEDRTKIIDWRLQSGETTGTKGVRYLVGDPEYENVLEWLGPIEPGQNKYISTNEPPEKK